MEVFKEIEGYEGLYLISNLGSLKRKLKFRKYRDCQEKILNPGKDKDGYFRTVLTNSKGIKKNVKIHRLVAFAFIENSNNKPCVNHINGIKDDNKVENLEWVTVSENNYHAFSLGLNKQEAGELHHMSKLKKNEVEDIRLIYKLGKETQKSLALKYGISQTQVFRIIHKKRWKL